MRAMQFIGKKRLLRCALSSALVTASRNKALAYPTSLRAMWHMTLGYLLEPPALVFIPFLFLSIGVLLHATTGTALTSNGSAKAPALAPTLMQGSGSGTMLPDLFTGTMSHTIPLVVPPGRHGIDPGLALTYQSTNGESWVGVGWTLEVGAIERSARHGVIYTGDDYVFRMAGATVDLVATSTGEYRAKIEAAFTRLRQLTAADGRLSWEATDRLGTRYLFGQQSDSRQDDPSDVNHIFKWCLDRVEILMAIS